MTKKKSIIKYLSSLKLAVVVILALAILAAVGTIYEARLDAEAASAIVYRSPWMYVVLTTLALILIAVMIDRWPWKMRHIGFISAHIGIIILLFGGILTQMYGIDGSMFFEIGTRSGVVTVSDKEISVYSTFDGNRFVDLAHRDVNFLKVSAKEAPIKIPVQEGEIEIIDSMNYALASERVLASTNEADGSGIRFQIANAQVTELQWLVQARKDKPSTTSFGPLEMTLGTVEQVNPSTNSLSLESVGADQIKYAIYKKEDKKPVTTGMVKEGDEISLPWMGFKFKVLRHLLKAHREWEIKGVERPDATTTSAVLVKYKDRTQWVQLNDVARFFTPNGAYLLKYGQKQVNVGEELYLKKFSVGHYQGTRRAMAYESVVEVPGVGDRVISMNEPLKYKGYTFYQSSFQQDPRTGEPTASILSVNKDPGRPLKYFGCLLMVLGIIHLFWFRSKIAKK